MEDAEFHLHEEELGSVAAHFYAQELHRDLVSTQALLHASETELARIHHVEHSQSIEIKRANSELEKMIDERYELWDIERNLKDDIAALKAHEFARHLAESKVHQLAHELEDERSNLCVALADKADALRRVDELSEAAVMRRVTGGSKDDDDDELERLSAQRREMEALERSSSWEKEQVCSFKIPKRRLGFQFGSLWSARTLTKLNGRLESAATSTC